MKVLFVGEDSKTVDTDDPALPRGVTPEKIRAGIDKAMADMRARGWHATECMVAVEPQAALAQLRTALEPGGFDAVVIGGGLRAPASRLELFEAVVNAVRKAAPDAKLAFNSAPEATPEAVARVAG